MRYTARAPRFLVAPGQFHNQKAKRRPNFGRFVAIKRNSNYRGNDFSDTPRDPSVWLILAQATRPLRMARLVLPRENRIGCASSFSFPRKRYARQNRCFSYWDATKHARYVARGCECPRALRALKCSTAA